MKKYMRKCKQGLCIFFAILLTGCGGARSIEVTELNGTIEVTKENETRDAYVSEHLVTGEAVSVYENSNLLLLIDADKHLYADANTKFNLIADGKKKSTKTKIIVEEGTVLCGIDNKLGAKESFEVETPNALMAVRGTVFDVSVFYDTDGTPITKVSVTEGFVDATCAQDGEEITVTLNVGDEAQINGYKDHVTVDFVEAGSSTASYGEKTLTLDDAQSLLNNGDDQKATIDVSGAIMSEDDPRFGQNLPIGMYWFDGDPERYDIVTGTLYRTGDLFPAEYESYVSQYGDDLKYELMLVTDEPYNGQTMFEVGYWGVDNFALRTCTGIHATIYGEVSPRDDWSISWLSSLGIPEIDCFMVRYVDCDLEN